MNISIKIKNLHTIPFFLFKRVFRLKMQDITIKQLTKHYFVGGLSALLNYLLFNIFMFLNLGIKASNAITYIILFFFSFLMQKHYTYKVFYHSAWQPILFLANTVVYFTFDTFVLIFMINAIGMHPMLAKVVSIVLLAPLSFMSQKYIVFKDRRSNVLEQNACF